ncbi:MAG: Ig-like domain-containing protein, partial [Chitinophagales bacterium]
MSTYIYNQITKVQLIVIFLFLGIFNFSSSFAQVASCGFLINDGCPSTNYNNSFLKANNDASTIEYDNFVSTYHASAVRTFDGTFQVWGEDIGNNGTTDILSPITMNATNYPALGTARVFKVTGGSQGSKTGQFVALTSVGLYAWGNQGQVLDASLTTNSTFQRLTIGGNTTGLPAGVAPQDVKMMVATVNDGDSDGTLLIVTCSGNVWVISESAQMRGNGGGGNATTWYQVTTNQAGSPALTNVVAARLSGLGAIALKSDGTLWTWGFNTYLGDNSNRTNRNRATQMVAPPGTIKMIGTTASEQDDRISYYVLMTNNNLYSLGGNDERQLGDFSTTERRAWVQPRYSNNAADVMNNIKWLSPSENDGRYAAVNVINSDSTLYAFGYSSNYMLGLGNDVAANPAIPSGISTAFKITSVNTGGHTTMVTRKCSVNFGYVGHRVRGSMGNGSAANVHESTYTFATAAVPICGTSSGEVDLTPNITGANGLLCVGRTYNVVTSIPGGTLTATGPVTLSGNSFSGYQIVFNSIGTSVLTYQLPPNSCGISPLPVTLNVESERCDADIAVVKTANTLSPTVGGTIVFTVTVSNNGPNNATGIVLNDILPSGYTYVSDNGGGSYNNVTGVWTVGNISNTGPSRSLQITATVLSTGNYTNVATVSGNQQDLVPSNNTSQVQPTPVCINPTLGGPSAVCVGSTITVTPTSGGTWTSSNGNVTVSSAGVVTGISAGTSTLTYTLSSTGCFSTKLITVNALPTLGGATSVCVGSTANVSPATGGIWTSSNTSVATVTNAGVVTGVANGTVTLSFTQTSTGCTSTRVMTVNSIPVLSGPSSICVGGTANFTSSGAGTWSSSNPAVATINNSGLANGLTSGVVTLTFTQTSTGCTASTTLTINALPVLSGATSVCVGSTANVSPSTGGTWTSSNPSVASVTNAGLITGNASGAVVLTFTSSSTGCTATRTITVNVPPILSGPSSVCVGNTINVGPSSGGTWTSSNPAVASVTNAGLVSGITVGSVTLTFTNSTTLCTATKTVSVNATPTAAGATTTCVGQTANVTPSTGGTWSSSNPAVATVSNAGVVSGISAGTVTLTFTATTSGCTATRTFTVNAIPVLGGANNVCVGSNATVSPTSGGTWSSSNPAIATVTNAGVVNGLTAGSVNLIFTETATGCAATKSFTVNALPVLAGPTSVCVGATISVTPASGGTWSSSNPAVATVNNAGLVSGLTPGTVTLTFTNSTTLCSATRTVTVNALPVLGGATAVCVGSLVNVSPSSGGTWTSSNPALATITNAGVVSGLAPGAVTLTFTSSTTGCSNTRNITINSLPTLGGDSTVCVNGTANVSPNAGGFWTSSNDLLATVSNTGLVSGVAPGNVTLTFTQSSTACSNTLDLEVLDLAVLGAVSTSCNPSALSYTVSLSVTGQAPFVATGTGAPGTWTGSNWISNDIPVGTNYNINITDLNACNTLNASGIAPVCDPCVNTVLNLNITKTDAISSLGCNNGTAFVAVTGGTMPYTYSWSDGLGTNATASGMTGPGTYTVVVTDSNNCSLTQSLVIDCVNDCDAVVSINSITAVACNGGNTGSATVSATSASHPGGPFDFIWTKSGTTVFTSSGTSSTLLNATAGVYVVSVNIQGTACQAVQQSVTIAEPLVGISVNATTLQNQLTIGGTQGSVTASASGGTPPYTYLWGANTGNASTQTVSGLLPGTYCVVATDANGCSTSQACTVVNPYICTSSPVITFTSSNVSCNGLSNGSITTLVNGGTAPYTYSWSNGLAAIPNHTNLAAGTYAVTVTDATGCQSQSSVTITQPNALSAGIAVTNVQCNGASTGALNLTVNGGTSPYSFVWSNGPTTEDQNSVPAGTYSVTVTDARGCTATANATINEPTNALSINLTKTDATLSLGCNDGTASVAVTGGTAPYTYLWSGGLGTNSSASNMTGPGTYSVTVTDANGCQLTQSVTIVCVNDCDAVLSISSISPVLCNGGNTGSAVVTASSSAHPGGPFNFVWTKSGTTVFTSSGTSSTLSNATAGVYVVSATIQGTSCQAVQQSVTIAEPFVGISVNANTLQNQLTIGGTQGTVSATATGGTAPYTYQWGANTGNATTQTVSGLLPDTYCVIATDANGCVTGQACTVVNPYLCTSSPTISFNNVNVSCNGLSNGTITTNVTGGISPYTYSWSNGLAAGPNQSGLAAGTYSVTVTDATGCQSQSSTTITQPNPLSAGIAVTNVQCNGASTGALNLTVNGGTAPYSFAWNNGPSTEDQNSVPAGTYSVTVTDARGCTATANATINEPTNALSLNLTKTDATLSLGCNDGTANVAVTGGTAPYTYLWSNGLGTNASASNMAGPGTYTVTVTDANGCQLTQSVTIVCVNDCDAVLSISNISPVLCNGGNTGTATVNASSVSHPGGPFNFIWTKAGTTVFTSSGTSSTLLNATAGVYVVSATIQGTSCQAVQQSVTIAEPLVGISVNATTLQNQLTIGGSQGTVSALASGGTAPYSYQWGANAGNATTQTVSGLLPGTYCVTATDANGCVSSQVCTVVNPYICSTSPIISFNTTNVSCNGFSDGSIITNVNGGTAPYTYSWSGGLPAVANQSVLASGTYSVTVTDATGCQSQSSTTITQPNALSAGIAVTNVQCNGASTGALNLTVNGGTAPYSFVWNNGPTTEDQNSVPAGTYSVSVTDAKGCTATANAIISEPSNALSINLTKTDATSSAGCNDGTANVVVTGGTAPYTYLWSNGLGTNATASNMTGPGTYTITVTDANGCQLTQSVTIVCVNDCDAVISINNVSNVLCNGGNTGSAVVTASSVAHPGGPFDFVWTKAGTTVFTSSGTTSTLSGVTAGVYVVSATIQGTACQAVQQSVTISEPLLGISANATTLQHQLTIGGTQGTVSVNASGGTAPYTYLWGANTGNATTQTVSGLLPGTYCVVATDANGCVSGQVCTVVNPFVCTTSPSISFNSTNVSCNGFADGSIITTVNGGTAPYTYSWSGGLPATANQSALLAGIYSVTVTDANGCQSQSSTTITQPNALSAGIAVTNVQCNGASTGALNLTVNGGTTPYSYSWSNGPISEDQNSVPAGAYSVTITDAKSCVITANANISQPATAVGGSITKVDAQLSQSCANGQATVIPSGGTAPYTYSWSDPSAQTSATATGLQGSVIGTNYNVTITDANGCTSIQSVSIGCTDNCDAIIAIDTVVNVLCRGESNGSATVSASSVNNPAALFTFTWSTGQINAGVTSSTLSAVPAGTYSVSVTINGTTCPAEVQSITITQPANNLAANVTGTNETALGASDGTAAAAPSGGTAPYTYLWSANAGSATTSSVSGLAPGSYCVTVTDANGCTANGCYEVLTYACLSTAPNLSASITNVQCFGDSTGQIVANVTNIASVISPISYTWTGSSSITNTASNLPAGSYSVTVTGGDGCFSVLNPIVVSQPTSLSASIAVTNVLCNGASTGALNLTVSGGTAPYTYLWSNSLTSEDLSGLSAGPYSVVITDANLCSISRSATITQPTNPISLSFTSSNALLSAGCNNGSASVSASGGTAPYTYLWSGGLGTNPSISNLLAPGTYTVTVTDANSCTSTQSVSITCTDDCDVVLSIDSISSVLCRGGNSGTATVSASSVSHPGGPFTFNWTRGGTTVYNSVGTSSTLTNASAGTYLVNVGIQGTTCPLEQQVINITEPSASLSASATTIQNQLSVGGTQGTVTATASGGTAPYSYQWGANAGNATSQTVSALLPGTYCVQITDANGCSSATVCTTVLPYTCGTINLSFTNTNITCNGFSNGAITTIVNGGTAPYTYSWTGAGVNPSSQNQSGLAAGIYNLTVTDAAGCTATASTTLTQPIALTGGITATNVACNGGSTGSLNLSVSGGTAPYTYLWSNGPISEDQSLLPAGTYTVVVTDANSCMISRSATITQPATALSLSTTTNNALLSASCANGSATALASGGTAPYSYSWSNGLGTNPSVSNLTAPGNYTVVATDANGCSTNQTITINCTDDCDALLVVDSIRPVLCNAGNTGFATVSASSVSHPGGPFTFSWTRNGLNVYNSTGTTSSLSNAVSGNYVVNVTIQGTTCPAEQILLTIPEPSSALSASASTLSNQTSVGGTQGTVTAVGFGGTAPYSYQWGVNAGNATTQTVSGLLPGNYCVVITDANGCSTALACTTVNPYNCPSFSIGLTPTNINCFGFASGAIVSNVSGGTAPFTYAWTGTGVNATSQNQSGLTAGTYNVTVTDAAGCTASASTTITQPNALAGSIVVTNVLCNGGSTGALNLTVSGGTAPYTYSWSNGPITEDQSGLAAGVYSVTVSDANGCTITRSGTISQPANPLSVSINGVNALLSAGCNNGSATAIVSGGTAPYTYVWSSGLGTNATANNLIGPGTYIVNVTDANGCTASQSVDIVCTDNCDALLSITNISNVLCNGGNTGSATISASSVSHPSGPFNFTWTRSGIAVYSSTGTSSTLSNATAGAYLVSVTIPGTVCPAEQQLVTIAEPFASLSASAATLSDQTSVGGLQGSVTATGFGGTAPYSYQWGANAGNATTQTVSGLLPGSYCVVITDSNGCVSAQACTTVLPYVCPTLSISFTRTNVSCNGFNNGAILTTITGGTAPYTYAWTGTGVSPTSQNQSGLAAGTYSLTVTDSKGCQVSSNTTITQPTPLTGSIVVTNVLCNGGSTGSLNLTVNGGTPPYDYAWSNGPITEDQSGLTEGTYTVVVTDDNGCTITRTGTIIQPANGLSLNITVVNANTSNSCLNGSATANVTGGTPPYTYAWGPSASNQVTATATGLLGTASGTSHSVVVTDANGCSTTQSTTILCVNDCDAVIAIDSINAVACNGDNTGFATVSASSVLHPGGPFDFIWTRAGTVVYNSSGTTSTLNNASAGVYIVSVVIQGTACPAQQQSVTISQPLQGISANAITTLNQQTVGGTEGTVSVNTVGGTPPYTYQWDANANNATTQAVTGLLPGTYCVVVTDANGCATGQVCTVVTPFVCLGSPTISFNTTNVSCNGLSDGQITTSVNGGNLPYSYVWTGNGVVQNSAFQSNLAAGTYSVNVTDATGCSAQSSINISQPNPLSAGIAVNNALCAEGSDGSMNLTVAGGVGPYTFAWSPNGQVTEDINNLPVGYYSVLVTDNNGCTISLGDTIGSNPPIEIDAVIVSGQPTCGNSDGSLTLTGLFPNTLYEVDLTRNGVPVPTLTFGSNSLGEVVVSGLIAGTYNLIIVTDVTTGCTSSVATGPWVLEFQPFPIGVNYTVNPTTCGGSNGSIILNGLDPLTSYSAYYELNGNAQPVLSFGTDAGGNFTIANLVAGVYTNFVLTQNSFLCTSDTLFGPVVITDPVSPSISAIINVTNPTACNTSNGRFTIAGLTPGQYTVEYESPTGTVFYPVSGFVTVSASGNLTINGLDNGVYSNIIVQNAAGCSSIPLGPVTLVDPIVNLGDAGANDTICLTTSAALTIAPQVANLTVTWRNIDFSIITILGPANFPSYTHLVSPLNNTCYIAEIFDNTTGCSELDTVCVYVSKAPELNLEANCFSLDEDSDITLSIINDIYANDNMSNIYGPGDLNANLDITILSNVQHGVLSINEALDQIVYTPYANYFGTDTLFYQVCNADCAGALFCDDAYLCFNVLEVNDAPIAVIDFNNTTIGNAVTGNVLTNDYDVEGDALTATLISSANGTYGSITSFSPNGDYIYTPSGTEGTDVFTYQVCDDGSPILCDTNIIVINVIDYVVQHNTNNAPIANPDGMIALQGTPVVSNVMANDFDPDSDDTISVTSFTQPLVGTGTVSISPQGQMTYTPPVSNPNFSGLVEFTYVICDNGNPSPVLCDTALVQIEVLPLGDPSLNNPPTAVDDAISTGQDTPANGNLAANDFDVDGDQLSFSILGGTTTSAGGTISGFNPTTGTFTYTPAQGYEGPDGFLYSVCDNGSPVLCDTATVVITVIYDNNAPIAIDDINNGFMNTSVLGNVATNDSEPDGDEVVFTIISPASSGTLTLDSVTGAYVYTPVLGFEGSDEFSYSICDDANPILCDTATVSINIENIVDGPFTNNEPIASNDNTITYGANPVSGNVLSNDFDPDGDNLVLNTTPLSSSSIGSFSLLPNGNFTYTPVLGFEGTVEFVYQVCDDGIPSLCDTASVIIEVFPPLNQGENEGPFAVDDAYGTDNETIITANVLVNDVLPNDGDVHTVTLVSSVDPAAGTLTLDNLGNFVFTPATDVETTTSFVYALCDDANPITCDTATAVIMIWDANVPPVAVNDFNNTLIGVPVSGDVSTNDFDANNDVLVFTQIGNIPSSEGSLVINPDGTYVFTPATGFVGQVEATYAVCDDNTTNFIADNACDTAILVINVVELNSPNGDNNSPVANDDNIVVTSLGPITSNVLANDFDVDGDSLIINTTPLSGPSAGTVVINTDGSFIYTPQADTTGIFTFEYSICDNGIPSLCDTATVSITVLEPLDSTENQAPFAVDDAFAGLANEIVNGNVYVNDINPDSDPLVMDTLSQPSNGTITFFDPITGDFTYVPNDDYVGPDAFTYTLCDNGTPVLCSQATVELLIYNNNIAPVAVDDINATIVNVAVSGDVSTNDFDPNTNDVLSFAILDDNGNNVVMDSTGVYTFTPLPGDTGNFSFTYYVCDDVNPALCDTATVVISVDGFTADPDVNNEPVANNDNLLSYGTGTVVVNAIANDYDPDLSDVITITGIIPSTLSPGITVIDNGNGSFTLTPDVDTLAQYSFDYVLCDNANPSLCDTATVSIIVLPLNNPNANLGPIAIDDVFAIGDNEILSANVGTNDINPDTDPLSFSVLDSTSNGVITSFDPATGTFTYVPNTDYAGPDNFTYVVCDTLANCDSATVYIVVYPNNEYPIAVNDINVSYVNTPVSGDVSTNDIDPDADPLVFAVVDQTSLNGTLVFAADGTYTFVPATDFEGQTSFTYSACDDGTPSLCDTATVVINVESFDASDNANNDPVANDDNIVVTTDSPLVVCVVCNDFDIDGDSIYVSSIINPNGYNVVNNGNGSFTVTPPVGVNDTTITVDYVLCDNGTPVACDTATLTIDIVPTTGDFNNLPPFAVDDAFGTVIGEVVSANVAANDILPNDGDTHSFAIVNGPANGTVTSFDPATGAFTYVPDSAYYGPDNFSYVVCDNGTPVACDTATVVILIYNDNDYPNAVDDINVTLVGTPVSGDVSTNDTDPDGDNLTFDNVTNPSNGTLVFNPDGTYTYTPAPGFDGQDEFTYVVCDDGIPSLCDTATVVINVENFDPTENNDPVANDDNVQTHADVPVTVCLTCNDFDVDGDSITVTTIINPDGYNVVDNGDGTVTITPPAGVEDTTITIQYVICDDGNPVACDTASVNVEVLPALEPGENEGPFAVDDAYSTVTDGTITANVSENDILPNDGDTHNFTVVNNPVNGTITSFDPTTGAFTYVPDSGYYGPDNFTYVVCDSGTPVECDTATVVILIYNDNHNPIAVNDINVTLVGTPVNGDVSTNDTDPDGNNLTFDNVTNPSNGTLVFNPDGTYTYTPAPGFDGQDEFTYVVCDDGIPSLCDTAT